MLYEVITDDVDRGGDIADDELARVHPVLDVPRQVLEGKVAGAYRVP